MDEPRAARLRVWHRWQRDEQGALQVVEALLAGTIILTAVLFVTTTGAPSPSAAESGIELAGLAKDTMELMINDRPNANVAGGAWDTHPTYAHSLEEAVSLAMGTLSTDAADHAARNLPTETYLDQVLPVGVRYQLRLDNGIEPLQLLPADTSFRNQPRAAKAAETFIAPPWQANADVGCTITGTYYPGGPGPTLLLANALEAPNGATIGPGGDTWSVWWDNNDADANANTIVPYSAPFGVWEIDSGAGACFRITLPDGTATDHPVYGVQMVVWPVAG